MVDLDSGVPLDAGVAEIVGMVLAVSAHTATVRFADGLAARTVGACVAIVQLADSLTAVDLALALVLAFGMT